MISSLHDGMSKKRTMKQKLMVTKTKFTKLDPQSRSEIQDIYVDEKSFLSHSRAEQLAKKFFDDQQNSALKVDEPKPTQDYNKLGITRKSTDISKGKHWSDHHITKPKQPELTKVILRTQEHVHAPIYKPTQRGALPEGDFESDQGLEKSPRDNTVENTEFCRRSILGPSQLLEKMIQHKSQIAQRKVLTNRRRSTSPRGTGSKTNVTRASSMRRSKTGMSHRNETIRNVPFSISKMKPIETSMKKINQQIKQSQQRAAAQAQENKGTVTPAEATFIKKTLDDSKVQRIFNAIQQRSETNSILQQTTGNYNAMNNSNLKPNNPNNKGSATFVSTQSTANNRMKHSQSTMQLSSSVIEHTSLYSGLQQERVLLKHNRMLASRDGVRSQIRHQFLLNEERLQSSRPPSRVVQTSHEEPFSSILTQQALVMDQQDLHRCRMENRQRNPYINSIKDEHQNFYMQLRKANNHSAAHHQGSQKSVSQSAEKLRLKPDFDVTIRGGLAGGVKMPICNAGNMRRSFENITQRIQKDKDSMKKEPFFYQSLKTDRSIVDNEYIYQARPKPKTSQGTARPKRASVGCNEVEVFDYISTPLIVDHTQRKAPAQKSNQRYFKPDVNCLYVEGEEKLSSELKYAQQIPEEDRVMLCWPGQPTNYDIVDSELEDDEVNCNFYGGSSQIQF